MDSNNDILGSLIMEIKLNKIRQFGFRCGGRWMKREKKRKGIGSKMKGVVEWRVRTKGSGRNEKGGRKEKKVEKKERK